MESLPKDVHLLAQMILYFAAVGTGLVTSVPTALTQNSFHGGCILYGDLDWVNSTYVTMKYGSSSSCNFVVYVFVFCGIIYGLVMGAYYTLAVYRSRSNADIAYDMWVMPFLLSNTLVILVSFVAACVLSVGFTSWCNQVMDGKQHGAKFKTCSGIQGWLEPHRKYHFGHYYNYLTVAQVAAWVGVGIWSAQIILGFLRFYRIRKRRSQETFQGVSSADTDIIVA